MLTHIKIIKSVYDGMRADLNRPHPFAYERVGFIFAKKDTTDKNTILLIATDYYPIPDTQYIDDSNVGAKINSAAIRSVMERAYSTHECILHVHQHEHLGPPRFSKVDRIGYNQMIPSFHNLGGSSVHGALIFSMDNAAGLIWTSKENAPCHVNKLSIVGYPIAIQKLGMGIYV